MWCRRGRPVLIGKEELCALKSVKKYKMWKNCYLKGWLDIAKLKPLSLLISPLLMLEKAFDNVKKEK